MDKEFYISMGYHDQVPDQCILNYINEIKKDIQTLCQIRYIYDIHEMKLLPHNILIMQGKTFSVGKIIASYLENVTHICSFIVTAGKEYDAYIHRLRENEDIVKEFVADSIGSVIVEACVKKLANGSSKYILSIRLFLIVPDTVAGILKSKNYSLSYSLMPHAEFP